MEIYLENHPTNRFFVFHNPGELVSLHLVGLSHVYIYIPSGKRLHNYGK